MMGRRLVLGSLVAALLGLGSGPALAQTAPPRCAVLGQMAVTSWLEMLGMLSRNDPATVIDPIVARLDGLTGTYAGLGCDAAALEGAIDCLMTEDHSEGAQALASKCTVDAGLKAAE